MGIRGWAYMLLSCLMPRSPLDEFEHDLVGELVGIVGMFPTVCRHDPSMAGIMGWSSIKTFTVTQVPNDLQRLRT